MSAHDEQQAFCQKHPKGCGPYQFGISWAENHVSDAMRMDSAAVMFAAAAYDAGQSAALRRASPETGWRRACACVEPDPVMQADRKFYCHRCSFETGARPQEAE